MLCVYVFDPAGSRMVEDPGEISDLIERPDTVVWADVLHPSPEELVLIEQEFAMHPLAVEDASKHGKRH